MKICKGIFLSLSKLYHHSVSRIKFNFVCYYQKYSVTENKVMGSQERYQQRIKLFYGFDMSIYRGENE